MRHPKSVNFDWYLMADPGTVGSAFAALFIAYDQYIPIAFAVDEIYERNAEATIGKIGPKMIEICKEFHEPLGDWRCYYDPAAAWFRNEFNDRYSDSGLVFSPVNKQPGDKEEGFDKLNEMFERRLFLLSQRCGNAVWEYDNYMRDEKGRLPKLNDHQIDNARYFTKMAGVDIEPDVEREVRTLRRKAKRRHTVSLNQDLKQSKDGSWMGRILKRYGE